MWLAMHTTCYIHKNMCFTYVYYYFSVPRHKISGAIKGFAFVEFSRVVEATAALEVCLWRIYTLFKHLLFVYWKSHPKNKNSTSHKEYSGIQTRDRVVH